MTTSADCAAWASAFGTIAAVLWGVWQVNSDRRRKRSELCDAIHEIASASERVAIAWEKLSNFSVAPPAATSPGLNLLKYETEELEEVLDRLLQRRDLTDGAVLCGVRARQLAKQLHTGVEDYLRRGYNSSYLQSWLPSLLERAQDTLDASRNLRKAHGINSPRQPYSFVTLKPPQ